MEVPDRETAARIFWLADGLLSSGGHGLPTGLMVALREYKSALLAESANEQWARPGNLARYGVLADLIDKEITNGKWKPGERLPSAECLANTYGEKSETVDRALHVLAVRGKLALENRSYYVLPLGML
jgi:hypothetical protein